MRLKVLIFPFFIIMGLILIIGYIKPDIAVMQEKQDEITVKKDSVANVDTVVANTSSLNGSLDTQQDFEKFVYHYLPETLNEEQIVDAFNYFATQSGVVITKMTFEVPNRAATLETGASGADVSSVAVAPATVQTFVFSGSVAGSYESIKKFLDYLGHVERFQKITLFSVVIDPDVKPVDTSRLVGTLEAEFGYLPSSPLVSAIDIPIFRRPKFDFSNVGKLLEQLTSTVPPLEKGQTGKPNPFQ